MGKKQQLERDMVVLREERSTFERYRDEEMRKLKEARMLLDTESQRQEQLRSQMAAKEQMLTQKEKESQEKAK